jgi:hypothetical protein
VLLNIRRVNRLMSQLWEAKSLLKRRRKEMIMKRKEVTK